MRSLIDLYLKKFWAEVDIITLKCNENEYQSGNEGRKEAIGFYILFNSLVYTETRNQELGRNSSLFMNKQYIFSIDNQIVKPKKIVCFL